MSGSTDEAVPSQSLFGIRFSNVTRDEAFAAIDARIARGEPAYVVTPNVDHVCMLRRNAAFRAVYDDAFMAWTDGVPVLWAARLLGKRIKEKLSGSDMIDWLSRHAAERGYSVFLFGAAPGVAETAAQELQRRYPALKIAGTHSPPMGFEQDAAAEADALSRISAAAPTICFVALGAPRQEMWIRKHIGELRVPLMIGIGASLDFLAGRARRAPRWIQQIGLEWVWRLCQEPRRLWRRYLVDDMLFVVLVWRELLRALRGHSSGLDRS